MIQKGNKKTGFTLMELLIVIAIVVILVSIAIPTITRQLTKAEETADVGMIRSEVYDQQSRILAEDTDINGAIAAIKGLKLKHKKNLSCEGATVKYQATIIKNGSSKLFTWTFKSPKNN